ncbi:DUF1801 domain-containing protein [Robertkochia aurantiaca]|uniref:DUF1801 domain-containing protein n=1 Tax=Robertkochia aurantiaca TaxID=2873700 RepID=UPI001CCD867D|nr:DUF1801 domain-containing protein [Robertkochia sp. 3YJGBD-33]
MKIEASTPDDYAASVQSDRREAFSRLRKTILSNLPAGFEETMSYGMIGYVVPHSRYPEGYHCDPEKPLPFINLGSQKNYLALYHNGLYADQTLLKWFSESYKNETGKKPDMGKSCVRFRKMDAIPFDLIAELSAKFTPEAWISLYEEKIKR